MKRIKIINGVLLPLHSDFDVVKNGELILEGDTILALGEGPLQEEAHEIIDAQGQLIMPGLINTHTHAAMVLLRGYSDDLPLMDWLHSIWPLEGRLTGEYVYWATLLASLEMLKSGTTTFVDMYFFLPQIAQAVSEIGIRAVLARGLIGEKEGAQQRLQEAREFTDAWEGGASGRITTMIAPHAPYTCPEPFMKNVLRLAQELNRPLHIHLSETRQEVLESKKEYGISPIALMEKWGLLSHPHVLAAHCVHVDEGDLDLLASRGIHVASNPQSNLKLGSGIAPLKEMGERGINVSLGTDGAASNNNLNLWEEIRLATCLQKGLHEDASIIPAGEALLMATRNAARACGLEKEVGSLHPGKKGDLIFMDLEKPHLLPRHDLLSHLVYSLQGGEINRVFVNGQEVMADGALVTCSEEEIMTTIQGVAQRLLQER